MARSSVWIRLIRTATPSAVVSGRSIENSSPPQLIETADTPAIMYIDLHLTHEVTTPQAYTVLRDSAKRAQYDRGLAGDRAKNLRYTEVSEEEKKKYRQEEIGQTPQGRKYFQIGMVEFNSGRFEAAARAFIKKQRA